MRAHAKRDVPNVPMTVVIVDDERAARSRLRRLLSDEPDVEIVSECDNGKDAVAAILEHSPDLVFLDIEMPELTGFQVLEELPDGGVPAFVFVTAFSEYAPKAFVVDALDYLLKPFDADRFRITMGRARERVRAGAGQRALLTAIRDIAEGQREIRVAVSQLTDARGTLGATNYVDRLAIKTNGRIVFVRVDDIDYVESAANYVRLWVGSEKHMLREPLGTLGERLDPGRFARIHRTTIVNVDRIKEIQPWFSGDALVILRTGVKLRLSRLYRGSLDLGSRAET